MPKARTLRLTAVGYTPCEPADATHLEMHTPGPIKYRVLPLQGTPAWTWNGDLERPTLSPSILTRAPGVCDTCHCFVKDGQVEFLYDCTHPLAGQTLDLLDMEVN